MRIELPEDPQEFPREKIPRLLRTGKQSTEQDYNTIGQFYHAIIQIIDQHPEWIKVDPSRQVVNKQWFSHELLFPITCKSKAMSALEIIVDQGEGAEKGKKPLFQGYIAHYYNFSQIAEGARLYQKPSGEFVYNTAEPINLDENCIWDLVKNSKATDYKPGSVARRMVDQFNYSYTSLLNGLHKTFNGEPN